MASRRPHLALDGPLSPVELRRIGALAARMPLACTATPRRRRFLFLGLAAPGFAAVFGTPLHQNLAVLVAGFGLFGAACVFRRRTEKLFVRAEAAALWPPVGLDPSKGALHHA
jgi:hypothetical protein